MTCAAARWSRRRKAAFLWLLGSVLAPPALADSEELGLRYGSATIQAAGYSNSTYAFSQVLGFDLQAPITKSSAVQLALETVGQPYNAGSLGWRYFPLANASKHETVDAFAHLTCDDGLRPFLGFAFGFGRIRLRTLSTIIEAQEIGASYYSYGATLGTLWRIAGGVSLGVDASYANLYGTPDAPVVFTGTRTDFHFGLYVRI